MGVLRSDRVSGLGGANAITGSTFFSTTEHFLSFDSSDINFDTGDFTVEAYVFHTGGNDDTIISDVSGWTFTYGASGNLRFYMATGSNVVDATSSFISNEWVHVAVVRSSGTLTFYQNGTAVGSHSYSHDIANNSGTTYIGKYHSGVVQNFIGHISNLRVVQGTALYTGAFTPPTSRLEKTSDTVLLTCNSASNVLNEETGKSLMNENPNYPQADQPGPIASRFVPDVGEDHGTTFGENTVFDTLSYMVPPGGTTAQSNRGRGVFGGGYTSSPSGAAVKRIYYIQIDSMGTSAEFGDTNKAAAWGQGGCSSSTRGLFTGGTNPTNLNTIDYITIATTSNALDFGDLSIGHGYTASCSNNTRGLTGGGRGGSPTARLAQIDYNTIATLGNGQDFGDLTQSRMGLGAVASSTRAVFTGGNGSPADPSTVYNNIDYVEFATTGNATDFGDMTDEHTYHGSCSSSTRGIIYGGDTSYGPTVLTNIIEYVTIASTGNGTDFGDVRDDGAHAHGTSNGIRGVFAGGVNPYRNSIDYITIATTGNGLDWGDLPIASGSYAYAAGLSDSHGGLS